jgi:hypothetical protein
MRFDGPPFSVLHRNDLTKPNQISVIAGRVRKDIRAAAFEECAPECSRRASETRRDFGGGDAKGGRRRRSFGACSRSLTRGIACRRRVYADTTSSRCGRAPVRPAPYAGAGSDPGGGSDAIGSARPDSRGRACAAIARCGPYASACADPVTSARRGARGCAYAAVARCGPYASTSPGIAAAAADAGGGSDASATRADPDADARSDAAVSRANTHTDARSENAACRQKRHDTYGGHYALRPGGPFYDNHPIASQGND